MKTKKLTVHALVVVSIPARSCADFLLAAQIPIIAAINQFGLHGRGQNMPNRAVFCLGWKLFKGCQADWSVVMDRAGRGKELSLGRRPPSQLRLMRSVVAQQDTPTIFAGLTTATSTRCEGCNVQRFSKM
jgi:hypothetical protein